MLTVSANEAQRRGGGESSGNRRSNTWRERAWEEAASRSGRSPNARINSVHSVAPEDVDQAVATTTVQGAAGTIVLEGELTWQQKVLLTLEEPSYSTLAQVFSYFILVVICASIASFVLEEDEQGEQQAGRAAQQQQQQQQEQYLLRFWVCNAFGAPTRLQFLRTPMNILDVVAVLPFYVELLSQSVEGLLGPLRVLRSVRLIRIFRIFRLSRYSMGMAVMIHSLGASVQPLAILVFFLIIGGTLFSSLLYYAEKMYCPDIANMSPAEFALHKEECIDHNFDSSGMRCCDEYGSAIGFASIMDATWWCAVTMTTVGYGDKVPATKLGQFIGGLTILSGIVLISLPVAIVGSRFQAAYEDAELEQQREVLEEKDLAAMAETKKSEGAESSGWGAQLLPRRACSFTASDFIAVSWQRSSLLPRDGS
ncbi:Potassium voltage-gated channel subfamily A member 2 [Symbiodinium microadriaticum]|uniref:Potassium voltage-gated channel subfamily A member 2 n=1 Tax=Symbiodinium microadriaticum TaxID=2951 RepID=A0A1Q9D5A5_SYMMI|nr:Potassium voltage-gated channel subfamily A member 2 [Symbiodinium microadriaticum]